MEQVIQECYGRNSNRKSACEKIKRERKKKERLEEIFENERRDLGVEWVDKSDGVGKKMHIEKKRSISEVSVKVRGGNEERVGGVEQ